MADLKEEKIDKEVEGSSAQNQEGSVSESDLDNISGGTHTGPIVTIDF